MLGAIHSVTVTASDLDPVKDAYQTHLGFQTVLDGTVSSELAASWGAPKSAGRRQLIMQPESGAASYMRFVETDAYPGFAPLMTYGWNSTEIIVQDLEALAQKLDGTPFCTIGPPAVLDFEFTDAISAMQVVGPGNEVLYLTQVSAPVPGFDLPEAKSFVDRIFVSILGGKTIDQLKGFYEKTFDVEGSPSFTGTVRVLNQAHDLPKGTKTTLASINLPGQGLIELDEFPASATERPRREGDLPPGVVMTTFLHDDLSTVKGDFLFPPAAREYAPYFGATAAALMGPTGELIELIESKS